MVTVVVLTVGEVVGGAVLADDVGVAEDVGVADALGDAVVEAGPPENRGWRNSIHESRYNTSSPSDTSSMVGDTA